jgi:hypothetical protein
MVDDLPDMVTPPLSVIAVGPRVPTAFFIAQPIPDKKIEIHQ